MDILKRLTITTFILLIILVGDLYARDKIIITSPATNEIHRFDIDTLELEASLSLPAEPTDVIVCSNFSGRYVLVLMKDSKQIIIINADTFIKHQTIEMDAVPTAAVISAGGHKAYVLIPGWKRVSIINMVYLVRTGDFKINTTMPVNSLAVKRDLSKIYIGAGSEVVVHDPQSYALLKVLKGFNSINDLDVSDSGDRLMVTDSGTDGNVHIINTADDTLMHSMAFGTFPSDSKIVSGSLISYVADELSPNIHAIYLPTGEYISNIQYDGNSSSNFIGISDLSLSNDHTKMITVDNLGAVSIYQLSTHKRLHTLNFGVNAVKIATVTNQPSVLGNVESLITDLSAQIAELSVEKESLKTEITALNSVNTQLLTTIANKDAEITALNSVNAQLLTANAEKDAQIAALRIENDALNAIIVQLETEIEACSATVTQLEADLASANGTIEELTLKNAELQGMIDTLAEKGKMLEALLKKGKK